MVLREFIPRDDRLTVKFKFGLARELFPIQKGFIALAIYLVLLVLQIEEVLAPLSGCRRVLPSAQKPSHDLPSFPYHTNSFFIIILMARF